MQKSTPRTIADAIVEEGQRLGIIDVPTVDDLRAMQRPALGKFSPCLSFLGKSIGNA